MDAVTTATRDGWTEHYDKATDDLQNAYDEMMRAARHLEPLQRQRVVRVAEKLERLIVRAIKVKTEVTDARAKAVASDAG